MNRHIILWHMEIEPGTTIGPKRIDAPETESAPRPIPAAPRRPPDVPNWLTILILAVIFSAGGYFRFVGINWDDSQHLHPDERFMTNVADAIRPAGLLDYFDTANSTLNPFPYGSFTYGMFPLFLTRYIAEAVRRTGYNDIVLVGRSLSALFDLAAVALLYLLGARLYSRRVGLLAAALSAAAVLPIQLSHYFAVDSFATVFIVAAMYVAAPAMDSGQRRHYAIFGVLAGLAMACKINTAPLAGIIVLAGGIRLAKAWPVENRRALLKDAIIGWLIAGALAALAFRIFQPYAFNGPSIFGISFNQRWLDIIREVTDQVAGRSEWPPNHHWTNRSQLTYAWTQLSAWAVGWPLGLASTLGWVWAAWRTWRGASRQAGEWQSHILLVVWVGAYFAWQNSQFWQYMRYFMPIYPFAILLAAWALIEIWSQAKSRMSTARKPRLALLIRFITLLSVGAVAVATYAYAYAFTRIYTRPHTRVAASHWILENIPGPLNLRIQTEQGIEQQPIAVPYDVVLRPGEPWRMAIRSTASGTLSEITSFRVYPPDTSIEVSLSLDAEGNDVIASGAATLPSLPDAQEQAATVFLNRATLTHDQPYYLHYTVRHGGSLSASALSIAGPNDSMPLDGELAGVPNGASGQLSLVPAEDALIDRLVIDSIEIVYPSDSSEIRISLSRDNEENDKLVEIEAAIDLTEAAAPRAFSISPAPLEEGATYFITAELISGTPLSLSGTVLAMETSWDDALPLRVGAYDPLGGIYVPANLELFERDDAAKRARILDALSRADYFIVSSNRSYDAMPRLPLRYPLTLDFYQALFNCAEELIYKCAYPAQPPLNSALGFELAAVFESNPTLGLFSFSDQTAEEAFTVYDHPKVFIFKKSPSFAQEQVRAILDQADLSQVIEQTPAQYTAMPGALLLPPDRLQAQTEGGTWSETFDPFSLLNWHQPLGVLGWYMLITAIGWLAFPLAFTAMPGLPDRGYPLSKLIGLLSVAWLAWLAASFKVLPFSKLTIGLSLFGLACAGIFLAYRQREQMQAFLRAQRQYLLAVEAITLALFLFFLFIRWSNPDIWHPWLGGEKPQDFTFFNAILKAVYFPPYHPWLSEHYINYYYYGYVIYAVPTKLLGIIPSIAYNLILPTMFALVGAGVFCLTYNIAAIATPSAQFTWASHRRALAAGVAAIALMLLLGNLFEVRLLWKFLPEVAEPPPASNSDIDRAVAVFSGAWRVISGDAQLPGDKGRWYFAASRAILHDRPESPITEFPLFSFLYADLHPHIAGMAIFFAALGWTLSIVLAAKKDADSVTSPTSPGNDAPRSPLSVEAAALWLTGGLVFGASQPTHTWDYPVLLALGVAAIIAATLIQQRSLSRSSISRIVWQTGLLVGLSLLMYSPFRQWFATEYSSVQIWQGARSPLFDYFSVHGLFLFILITYLIWETQSWLKGKRLIDTDWLLHTPLGVLLPQVRAPLALAVIGIIGGFVGAIALWINDYESILFIAPMLVWVALALFQRSVAFERRLWLILFGAGLGLTGLVELFVLRGDVARNNTVFRLYLQAWSLFSIAGGLAAVWLTPIVGKQWPSRLRWGWLAGLGLLVGAAGTYTALGIYMKVEDRWPNVEHPPRTLDGATYMLGSFGASGVTGPAAAYDDEGRILNLAYDYGAIRWMLENVSGTPVIVEGNAPLYHWGNRFAINTGLPAVVGWDWHLKQHNSVLPGDVVDRRLDDVREFYNTPDVEEAMKFLRRYNVQYIIVGEMERGRYEAAGIAKFAEMADEGRLAAVFPQSGSPDTGTVIYEVNAFGGE